MYFQELDSDNHNMMNSEQLWNIHDLPGQMLHLHCFPNVLDDPLANAVTVFTLRM